MIQEVALNYPGVINTEIYPNAMVEKATGDLYKRIDAEMFIRNQLTMNIFIKTILLLLNILTAASEQALRKLITLETQLHVSLNCKIKNLYL